MVTDAARPLGNLPFALNRFVGRERELSIVRERLVSARLLTLTGPGGCGKTRLALELASAPRDAFSDGSWFVDFAPLTDGALVPFSVASALGIREQPGRPILETLVEALRPRTLLIIFDNCEHLVAECAELAEALLQFCSGLKILATSREALAATGEVIWNVPPLALPRSDESTPDELSKVESVQLFVEKASAVMPEFALSADNAPVIAHICRELDGLPLAIELAAARCRALSVQEIAERLGERFSLLTMGKRTASPRHQTLQATIDWSYTLLDANERLVFQELAVFAGGWTLDAAEAVCAAHILDTLSHLVDKSLVVKQERNNAVRYAMLETIRHYAWDRLVESEQAETIRNRHLEFFFHLAEEAAPWLLSDKELVWLKRLQTEHDNLRAALDWSLQRGGNDGLRIVSALLQFWEYSGNLTEWSRWAERFIGTSANAPAATRARALIMGGFLARLGRDWARAALLLGQGLDLSKQLEDEQGIARALHELGVAAHLQGDRKRAIDLLTQSRTLYRQLGDTVRMGESLLWRADALTRDGNLAAAREDFSESFRIFGELGERSRTAWSLGGLGEIARLEGNYPDASRLLKEGLVLRLEIGTTHDLSYSIEALANLAAQTHAPSRAARLWAVGETLREHSGMLLPPSYQDDYAPIMNAARAELGDKAYSEAWSEGRAMTIRQAAEFALHEIDSQVKSTSPGKPAATDALTPRELEVLRLITAGLSNREIAEQMVLALGTVKWYTTTIYGKLNVESRTQAVALAKSQNLL